MASEETRQQFIQKYGDWTLDQLWEIEDDWIRGAAITGWIEHAQASDDPDADRVLIKTNDGKPLETGIPVGGKPLTITHTGRYVRRATAALLYEKFGPTRSQWAAYKAEHPLKAQALVETMQEKGLWKDGKPAFATNHVVQVLPEAEGAEEPKKELVTA
jgi:hypothetical protein